MKAFTIKISDVQRCPKQSLLPGHYRVDGSCKCGSGMCGTDDDPCVLCILCDEEPVDGETEMCSVCRSRGANV